MTVFIYIAFLDSPVYSYTKISSLIWYTYLAVSLFSTLLFIFSIIALEKNKDRSALIMCILGYLLIFFGVFYIVHIIPGKIRIYRQSQALVANEQKKQNALSYSSAKHDFVPLSDAVVMTNSFLEIRDKKVFLYYSDNKQPVEVGDITGDNFFVMGRVGNPMNITEFNEMISFVDVKKGIMFKDKYLPNRWQVELGKYFGRTDVDQKIEGPVFLSVSAKFFDKGQALTILFEGNNIKELPELIENDPYIEVNFKREKDAYVLVDPKYKKYVEALKMINEPSRHYYGKELPKGFKISDYLSISGNF